MAFLKWAGGKRWLAPILSDVLGKVDHYVEPFLGSGAVFFALGPSQAVLSDSNSLLVDAYRGVKREPERVLARLRRFEVSRDAFARVRDSRPRSLAGRAARLIYLNRTAFNGLYRVNRLGQFNVPFGCKVGTTSCDVEAIMRAAKALKRARLKSSDFSKLVAQAPPGAVIYADPPYVLPDAGGYARYNSNRFQWKDQIRLAEALSQAAQRGCQIVLSNALDVEISSLYGRREFEQFKIERPSRMSANPNFRRRSLELIVVSRNVSRYVRRELRQALCSS